MKRMQKGIFVILLMAVSSLSFSQKKSSEKETSLLNSSVLFGLKFRSIGPSVTAGRISDLAVNPQNTSEYYLAIASGGVFKTVNRGTTFDPIFDNYGSYSVGCITIDPNQSSTLWLGTGENNNQRSVAYGDGVYKSMDGGKSWKNMGLKESEHISKIIVDPRNSNVVYVAAYGPLWSAGGERGVYKSEDGGETWKQVHFISENTGTADLVMDPSNPDVLYAAVHQRRRHVYTYIGGGEESALYKSSDAGQTWQELKNGLPSGKMGRIGLAISPVKNNYVYAIIEGQGKSGGFYRSTNSGASWEKRSDYSTSGNYYQEIYCDLTDADKVFSMNTWLHHTEDGGKTFQRTGESQKHVDNHCMWINPLDPNHWLVGCDGGLYETWDHAQTWQYKPNLPITQFYKVAVDNASPFYNVYGGTQDNNSLGGPSRTINNAGILNSDWFITNGGDGFESQIDPKNPNIVYAQAQYGWLVRYDKASGEKLGIQPMPGRGEAAYRWNWDAPLVISNHDHKRLYFAANKVFKSDDRGNTWQTISPDLTRQLDRNKMKVMGEIQSPDAVMKNKSTTIFGNIVALDESPINPNLLYAGSDDGLIHVSKDGGANWTKYSSFPGVPEMTYVNMLIASQHNENVVYAVFNNHKQGDFKPYILRSNDQGKSWYAIQNDLPERGSVYALAEDHVNENLLFAGTEFGLFCSAMGDEELKWIQLKAGLPTIAIRDIAIQQRENDLVLASFGRGFYVLDDYSALRGLTEEKLKEKAVMFPIRPALSYVESSPLGLRGVGSQGGSMYAAENPEFGATFTYYLKEADKSPKELRQAKEKKARENGEDIVYPTQAELVKEDNYVDPVLIFIVKDEAGAEVRKITMKPQQGVNRVTWNLRYPTTNPIQINEGKVGRYSNPDEGPMVLPGKYTVEMKLFQDEQLMSLHPPVGFEVRALENTSLPRQSKASLAFKNELSELRRRFRGTASELGELQNKLKHIENAVEKYPSADLNWLTDLSQLNKLQDSINIMMWGDYHKSRRDIETIPGTGERIETIVYQAWYSTSDVTQTQLEQLSLAKVEYAQIRKNVDSLKNQIVEIERQLNAKGVPYTPARSEWKID
jgi:photosystem II stability/assembly factor-like uncharacterized protein